MRFFEFYGKELDIKNVGVSLRHGGFFFDKDHEFLAKDTNIRGEMKLCVENPLLPCNDIGGAAYNFGKVIRKIFKMGYDIIKFQLLKSQSFIFLIIPEAHIFKDKNIN